MEITFTLTSEENTQELGKILAPHLQPPLLCFFQGELGAGKTSLIRAILRAKNVSGSIKSPSYTLIEPYEIGNHMIYHMDLYRLASADELEWLGIRDYLHENAICLIEWPERGGKSLPQPDLMLTLHYLDEGREITISSQSLPGDTIIKQCMKDYGRDKETA